MLHARRQCTNRQRTTTTTWPTGGDRRGITTTSVDRHYKGVRHVVVWHVLAIGMFFFQVVLIFKLFLTNHFSYILIFTMTRNHRWEILFISSYCIRRLGQRSTTQQCMTMTTVTRPPLAELNLHSTRRLWWMVNGGWYYNSEDERWGRLAQTRIGII